MSIALRKKMWSDAKIAVTKSKPPASPRPSIARFSRSPRKISSSERPVARKMTRPPATSGTNASSAIHGPGFRISNSTTPSGMPVIAILHDDGPEHQREDEEDVDAQADRLVRALGAGRARRNRDEDLRHDDGAEIAEEERPPGRAVGRGCGRRRRLHGPLTGAASARAWAAPPSASGRRRAGTASTRLGR